jgi:endoglucanase
VNIVTRFLSLGMVAVALAGCGGGGGSPASEPTNQPPAIPPPANTNPGTIAIAAATYSVNQSAGTVTVSVTRSGGSDGAANVTYATTDGTAKAGTDYTATTGTLTWAAGDAAAKPVEVTVNNATGFSGSRSFSFSLSGATGASMGGTASATVTINGSGAPSGGGGSGTLSVRVEGNHFVDGDGKLLQLRGVNTSGLEFVAIQNWSANDPWGGQKPNWEAIKSWKANAVRIPLNQASWLGQTCKDASSGATRSADPGNNYVATVTKAIDDATAQGLYVILDLHMSAPGTYCPMIQNVMADADNSLTFWTSIANTYKNRANVIFELFNEPFVTQTAYFSGNGWQYLMHGVGGPFTGFVAGTLGGGTTNVSYTWNIASMQAMLDAVRATGAANVVLVAGYNYAAALDGWLANKPVDSLNQMGAVWHAYPAFGTTYGTPAAAQPNFAPQIFTQAQGILDAGIPIVITELGENCTNGIVGAPETTNMINWADAHNVSLLGWSWNTWYNGSGSCNFILIKDANGTPTDGYGKVMHDWMYNHP